MCAIPRCVSRKISFTGVWLAIRSIPYGHAGAGAAVRRFTLAAVRASVPPRTSDDLSQLRVPQERPAQGPTSVAAGSAQATARAASTAAHVVAAAPTAGTTQEPSRDQSGAPLCTDKGIVHCGVTRRLTAFMLLRRASSRSSLRCAAALMSPCVALQLETQNLGPALLDCMHASRLTACLPSNLQRMLRLQGRRRQAAYGADAAPA